MMPSVSSRTWSPGSSGDGLGLGEIGLVGDSQRQAGAAEDRTDRPVVSQDVAGWVPGVRVDEGPRGRIEAGQEQGDEPAIVDVRGEGTVGQREDVADPRVGQRQRPQVGPRRRHQQGRAEAVAADIADGDPDPAVRQREVVEVVAARHARPGGTSRRSRTPGRMAGRRGRASAGPRGRSGT